MAKDRRARRDRVVSESHGAWCEDCHAYHGWDDSPAKVRMWAIRHANYANHNVQMTTKVIRRYEPDGGKR